MRLFLTSNKDIKSINKVTYITIADIESIYDRDICMSSTYTINIWIKYTSIKDTFTRSIYTRSTFIKDVRSKALVWLEVTLATLEVNDYCFLLSIKLIFALTKEVNY